MGKEEFFDFQPPFVAEQRKVYMHAKVLTRQRKQVKERSCLPGEIDQDNYHGITIPLQLCCLIPSSGCYSRIITLQNKN